MGQLYLQRFEYRDAIDKSAFDKVWAVANETMAKTGNWGGVKKGVTHLHAYGTAFWRIRVDRGRRPSGV